MPPFVCRTTPQTESSPRGRLGSRACAQWWPGTLAPIHRSSRRATSSSRGLGVAGIRTGSRLHHRGVQRLGQLRLHTAPRQAGMWMRRCSARIRPVQGRYIDARPTFPLPWLLLVLMGSVLKVLARLGSGPRQHPSGNVVLLRLVLLRLLRLLAGVRRKLMLLLLLDIANFSRHTTIGPLVRRGIGSFRQTRSRWTMSRCW